MKRVIRGLGAVAALLAVVVFAGSTLATDDMGVQEEGGSNAVPASEPSVPDDAAKDGGPKLEPPKADEHRKEDPKAVLDNSAMAKELTLDLSENVKLKLVLISAGKFLMGSPESEKGRGKDEGPQREVTIGKPFYMGVYEVTQEQYEALMGKNPSHFKGPNNPVEVVSWEQAVEFCTKLSEKSQRTVRLPTEAEWEYACRAGTKTRFSFGVADADLHKHGNYCDKANTGGFGHQDKLHSDGFDKTAPVGSFKPNAWGLYDMHGNVSEWCADWYQDSYRDLDAADPKGPKDGQWRVIRGGAWCDPAFYCRSARRNYRRPASGFIDYGFRIVVEAQ